MPETSRPPTDTAMPLAVVTGASSGIGRGVAELLAQRGYRTVLIARRMDRIAVLAKELARWAPSVAQTLDLADDGAIAAAMANLAAEHGPVSVLVNNAGYGLYKPFLDCSEDDFRRLMEVNYFAAASMIRGVLPGMLRQRRGHVINIASIATKMGPWGHGGYAAAKCALVSLTQSLAAEYGDQGIHFSYVNPGIVQTEFFDNPSYQPIAARTGRHAIPVQRVAKAIVGLLDRPQLELCVPRHYRILEWIKALSPELAFKLVAKNSRP